MLQTALSPTQSATTSSTTIPRPLANAIIHLIEVDCSSLFPLSKDELNLLRQQVERGNCSTADFFETCLKESPYREPILDKIENGFLNRGGQLIDNHLAGRLRVRLQYSPGDRAREPSCAVDWFVTDYEAPEPMLLRLTILVNERGFALSVVHADQYLFRNNRYAGQHLAQLEDVLRWVNDHRVAHTDHVVWQDLCRLGPRYEQLDYLNSIKHLMRNEYNQQQTLMKDVDKAADRLRNRNRPVDLTRPL